MISVIIPVRDDEAGLRTTLASLQACLEGQEDAEVIVCNDGGGEAISAIARQYGCREAKLSHRAGSYAARNAGVRISRGDLLAFLDADQRVSPRWLKAGLAGLTESDYVGGHVSVETPDDSGSWHRYEKANAFPVLEYLKTMSFAPTANLFVRREVFDAVGPFCDRLQSGGDWEFGTRVAAAGFRQAYCSDAVSYHASRGFGSQLTKIRRVATGAADVRFGVWREPIARQVIASAWIVARFPLQVVSQCLRWYLFPSRRSAQELPFVLIRKGSSAIFNFWFVIHAVRHGFDRLVRHGRADRWHSIASRRS